MSDLRSLRAVVEAKDVYIVGADDFVLPALLDVAEAARVVEELSDGGSTDPAAFAVEAQLAWANLRRALARLVDRAAG